MHFGHHGLMSTSALVSKEQQSLNVTCHVHKGMLEKNFKFHASADFSYFCKKIQCNINFLYLLFW